MATDSYARQLASAALSGGGGGGTDANAVHYTADANKTTEQKAQARTNINAQEALVSGTNIKTINNTSILGSGNITIDANNIFLAVYGQTTYADIATALNTGKIVFSLGYDGGFAQFGGWENNTIYFQGIMKISGEQKLHTISVTSSNVWNETFTQLSDVFYAIYDTTTFAQIKSAHDDGKLVVLEQYGAIMEYINSSTAIFTKCTFEEDDGETYGGAITVTCTANGWEQDTIDALIPTKTSDLTNDSSFASLPTTVNDRYLHTNASTGALEWSTISGGGEPNAYLKNASVSGNTLTLTKKDDSTVTFTPSGGGSEQLFFVTPEVTTNAAINAAINSGKLPVFTSSNSGGMMIPVVSRSGNTIEFGNIYCNNEGIYSVHYTVDEDDVWTNDIVSIGLTGINFRAEFFGASSSDNTTYAQMLNAVDAQGKQPFLYDYTEGYECATLYTIGEDASEHVVFTFKNIHVTDNNVIENTYVLTYSGWTKTTTTKALLPAYTASDEGKVLKIVNGTPTWTTA